MTVEYAAEHDATGGLVDDASAHDAQSMLVTLVDGALVGLELGLREF